MPLGDAIGLAATHLHLVWGRVAQTGIAAAVVVLEWGRLEHRRP
jgi:hypothetical protein